MRDSVDGIVAAWAARDPELDVAPLEVAGRVLLCAARLQDALEAVLAPLGLSFADFDVLNTLRREAPPAGMHPRDLARASLITSGAMTARLDRLERAGLVQRRPDPQDRRAVRVRLSRQGDALAQRALTAVLAADEGFLAPLSDPQRRSVAGLLRRLLVAAEAG